MNDLKCVAMILAGGKGLRLGALTRYSAKPAIHFGDGSRIIDFTLHNCIHSEISTLGILTQYCPSELHRYISGYQASAKENGGAIYTLPSRASRTAYAGTADAVYRNLKFIERFSPVDVLILSGDHVYRMDYRKMLKFHRSSGADATIAAIPVPPERASGFGILSATPEGAVTRFEEKPAIPDGCLASMGIYLFKFEALKRYLTAGKLSSKSDFGRDIIPSILSSSGKLCAYRFDGYWRDVGTVQSLWEANMDLVDGVSLPLSRKFYRERSIKSVQRPLYSVSSEAEVRRSILSGSCSVYGKIEHSVLCNHVRVGKDSEIIDSVLLPGVSVGENVKIRKAIVGAGTVIESHTEIGLIGGENTFFDNLICSDGISLIGPKSRIGGHSKIGPQSHINNQALLKSDQPSDSMSISENLHLAHA